MCTRTNSMYLYITWAMVHDGAEVYRTGMTIEARATRDEALVGYPYRARRERGSRGRIAFQISRYDYELHR